MWPSYCPPRIQFISRWKYILKMYSLTLNRRTNLILGAYYSRVRLFPYHRIISSSDIWFLLTVLIQIFNDTVMKQQRNIYLQVKNSGSWLLLSVCLLAKHCADCCYLQSWLYCQSLWQWAHLARLAECDSKTDFSPFPISCRIKSFCFPSSITTSNCPHSSVPTRIIIVSEYQTGNLETVMR